MARKLDPAESKSKCHAEEEEDAEAMAIVVVAAVVATATAFLRSAARVRRQDAGLLHETDRLTAATRDLAPGAVKTKPHSANADARSLYRHFIALYHT